ncbi:MAG: thiamine-phosphate kinase [Bacteroidales bacterium]
MENKKRLREISELGEFGLIDHLTKDFNQSKEGLIKGIGDDAAVFETNNKLTVVTTDLLVEGVHFNLIYTPLKHLGYKSVVVNLSDLYSMNAVPQYITVSIALSAKFSVEAVEEIYKGIKLACERFGVVLIGGDTTSSLSGLFINITAIGFAEKDKVYYRSGAKKNDLICVSGDLGAAYMGLQILEREKEIFLQDSHIKPDFGGFDYLIERQLKPEPRRDIVSFLQENNIKVNAMIDISDGLSSELLHLCKNSNLGCRVYSEEIPINPQTEAAAENFRIDALTAALNGGEDYELLFTTPIEMKEKIEKHADISIIGYMTEDTTKVLVTPTGSEIELKAQGWNAMRKND